LPTIIAVATLVSAAYMLTLVDEFINSTLYSYGLVFSYEWANPYWTLFKVTWALLAICAAAITINAILIVRSPSSQQKQQNVEIATTREAMENIRPTSQTRERTRLNSIAPGLQSSQKTTPKPATTLAPAPAPSHENSKTELFRCTHCNKTFTQPLRMLDFHVDPPRIVNVCPFCSETLSSAPETKESEQTENHSLFRKNHNHMHDLLTR
jgi:hypothetical protein